MSEEIEQAGMATAGIEQSVDRTDIMNVLREAGRANDVTIVNLQP